MHSPGPEGRAGSFPVVEARSMPALAAPDRERRWESPHVRARAQSRRRRPRRRGDRRRPARGAGAIFAPSMQRRASAGSRPAAGRRPEARQVRPAAGPVGPPFGSLPSPRPGCAGGLRAPGAPTLGSSPRTWPGRFSSPSSAPPPVRAAPSPTGRGPGPAPPAQPWAVNRARVRAAARSTARRPRRSRPASRGSSTLRRAPW